MLTEIYSKLPMRDKVLTKAIYLNKLDFIEFGDYGDDFIVRKDNV
ncbi:MAG: hypothetical protein ACTJHT_00910 [Sphingobacterium sp.]|nr:hypothetical protein [Sphingobacterium sp. JB170]SJN49351.1 hypothetical protein FM107_18530 [Sphingobacterium sp. JB170]